MANGWPTCAVVISANRRDPVLSNTKFTTHSAVCEFRAGLASVRLAPSTSTRRRTTNFWPGVFSDGRMTSPGGAGRFGSAASSTRWNVILAVVPMRCLMRFGSSTPGNCTTMRLSPCRVICGSSTPVASMRRRTISMDCCTAALARARNAASFGTSEIVPSGWVATSKSWPPSELAATGFSASSADWVCAGSRRATATRLSPPGMARVRYLPDNAWRARSRIVSSRSLRTASRSTWSSR